MNISHCRNRPSGQDSGLTPPFLIPHQSFKKYSRSWSKHAVFLTYRSTMLSGSQLARVLLRRAFLKAISILLHSSLSNRIDINVRRPSARLQFQHFSARNLPAFEAFLFEHHTQSSVLLVMLGVLLLYFSMFLSTVVQFLPLRGCSLTQPHAETRISLNFCK